MRGGDPCGRPRTIYDPIKLSKHTIRSLLWRNFLERGLELDALLSAHDTHNDVIYHSNDRNGKSLEERLDADLPEGGGGEGNVEDEGPAYQHNHAHNGQDGDTREARAHHRGGSIEERAARVGHHYSGKRDHDEGYGH